MSYVIAAPEIMSSAASDLAAIGSYVSAAHLAAAARTVAVVPAAADEVSQGIASVFANYAQAFHGLAADAAAFHDQFLQTLQTCAVAYSQAEALNIESLLSSLWSLLPPPIQDELLRVGFDAGLLLILAVIFGFVAVGVLFSALILYPLGWAGPNA